MQPPEDPENRAQNNKATHGNVRMLKDGKHTKIMSLNTNTMPTT